MARSSHPGPDADPVGARHHSIIVRNGFLCCYHVLLDIKNAKIPGTPPHFFFPSKLRAEPHLWYRLLFAAYIIPELPGPPLLWKAHLPEHSWWADRERYNNRKINICIWLRSKNISVMSYGACYEWKSLLIYYMLVFATALPETVSSTCASMFGVCFSSGTRWTELLPCAEN
jgi:hypothetical protein